MPSLCCDGRKAKFLPKASGHLSKIKSIEFLEQMLILPFFYCDFHTEL
jgi:hypothetical protein